MLSGLFSDRMTGQITGSTVEGGVPISTNRVKKALMPRLELLDGPKVAHGRSLVTCVTEHLQVELRAGVEDVRAVVDELLFVDPGEEQVMIRANSHD